MLKRLVKLMKLTPFSRCFSMSKDCLCSSSEILIKRVRGDAKLSVLGESTKQKEQSSRYKKIFKRNHVSPTVALYQELVSKINLPNSSWMTGPMISLPRELSVSLSCFSSMLLLRHSECLVMRRSLSEAFSFSCEADSLSDFSALKFLR